MKSSRIISAVSAIWRALGFTALSLIGGAQPRQIMRPPPAPKTGIPLRRLPGQTACCPSQTFITHPNQIETPKGNGIRTIPYLVPYPIYVGGQDLPEATVPPDSNPDQPLDGPDSAYPPAVEDPPLPPNESRPLEPQFAAPEPSCSVAPPQNSVAPVEAFIALKDHRVHTAIAYWLLGDTLHYITPLGFQNQVSLRLVDRSLTARLNSDRLLQLVLPPE
jgi:hypothetical protein